MYNQWDPMMNNPLGMGGRNLTKREIKEIMCYSLGAREVVSAQVGLQETTTKHICKGTSYIQQLSRQIFPIMTPQGFAVNVNYFFCNHCGKLIIDESSMEIV